MLMKINNITLKKKKAHTHLLQTFKHNKKFKYMLLSPKVNYLLTPAQVLRKAWSVHTPSWDMVDRGGQVNPGCLSLGGNQAPQAPQEELNCKPNWSLDCWEGCWPSQWFITLKLWKCLQNHVTWAREAVSFPLALRNSNEMKYQGFLNTVHYQKTFYKPQSYHKLWYHCIYQPLTSFLNG